MIKNIVFDLGRVIYTYWPKEDMLSLGYNNNQADELMSCIFNCPTWQSMDRGIYTFREGIAKMCKLHPQNAEDIRRVLESGWIDRAVNFMPGSLDLFNEVKSRGYKTYILSNMVTDVFDHLQHRDSAFFSKTDGIIISGREKVIKPEPEIYRCLLDRYALLPEETLFIDDMPQNIAAAKELGIHGIVFVDVEDCRRKLEQFHQ